MMYRRIVTGFILASVTALGIAGDNPIARGGEPYGLLVTSTKDIPGQIYPVKIEALGDFHPATKQRSLRIKPGTYSIRVSLREPVDRGLAPGVNYAQAYKEDLNNPPLELTVEPGKVYYIGARIGRPDERVHATVWKVEDAET